MWNVLFERIRHDQQPQQFEYTVDNAESAQEAFVTVANYISSTYQLVMGANENTAVSGDAEETIRWWASPQTL